MEIQGNISDVCLIDSATTHSILRDKKYFLNISKYKAQVNTISGPADLIEGYGKAIILLEKGTKICIQNALYSSNSKRNLLSFKDIRNNGYHMETVNEQNVEYLYITSIVFGQKVILEKLHILSSGLYYAKISPIETYVSMNQRILDPKSFQLWHDRLGHPGSTMMRRIVGNSDGHPLKDQKILLSKEHLCVSCSQGKLITKPSFVKINSECPSFLQRIQGDICGPIHPQSGPFRYFIVLIDASARWSHVCLLSTRNSAFAKLLAQIIKLRAQFPDYQIKSIRLDNAGEFTSRAFDDYCMSIGINVEHPVPHVHTQNGLAESLIKRLQMIARTLLLRTQLPISAWGHAILHAATLIRLRPTAYHEYSPLQLVTGHKPDISHLKIFGCAVYVPISPPQRTKMGPQRRLGIYVGYDSPSIIRYLEPMTGDLFTARFADCHFNEQVFPRLGKNETPIKTNNELIWKNEKLYYLDPCTGQCESEVRRIIHLQMVANQLPDNFTDTTRVTKSHIPARNTPARLVVPIDKSKQMIANEASEIQRKRGRPVGSKDNVPRKRKGKNENVVNEMPSKDTTSQDLQIVEVENPSHEKTSEEIPESRNEEISINYMKEIWNRKDVMLDDMFSYAVATEIMNDEYEPQSINECKNRSDWPKWKEAIQAELNSLNKRSVFGPIVQTPKGIQPVGYKWVFVRKRNEKNEIVRYKARLVAQGFSQRPGIDFDETYSPVMDTITFRFLIGLAKERNLEMRLMDVVTAYLYGSLDTDIFMKLPEGLKLPEINKDRGLYSVKLQRSLYGLKQSGRMWYNRLSEYLIKEGYINNVICPCVFIRKSGSSFVIVAVYVDDINLIGTQDEIQKTAEYLKREFEMKDLGKTKYCLGLEIEHKSDGILIHQKAYTEKILKRFSLEKCHSLSTPMVVRSLDPKKDPFRPKDDDENVLDPGTPYLSAIGALLYLAQCTRPDIAFAVNLLARYSSAPTRRHWNGIKHILRYLRGTVDLGLFYSNSDNPSGLIGYADAGYLSDPHKARSQTGYVFTYNGTAISWRSVKQTLVATSSNHAEILALHETSRECVWLRSIISHIQSSCGIPQTMKEPTIIFEDNAACIAQVRGGYIKGDRTKHISPKFFYTHELQESKQIDVKQIRSSSNLADLLTKTLPTSTFEKLVYGIGMRKLSRLEI